VPPPAAVHQPAHPRRFVVVPGHEQPEIEDAVEVYPDYLLTEKRGAAARMAETTDPRASEEISFYARSRRGAASSGPSA